jgi:hypothetical protein
MIFVEASVVAFLLNVISELLCDIEFHQPVIIVQPRVAHATWLCTRRV